MTIFELKLKIPNFRAIFGQWAWHIARLAQRSQNFAKSFSYRLGISANISKIIIPNKNQLLPPWPPYYDIC